MRKPMYHQIQRIAYETSVGDSNDVSASQEQGVDFCSETLVPILESVLDEINTSPNFIHIDKLEISLNSELLDDPPTLRAYLESELRKQLSSLLKENEKPSDSSPPETDEQWLKHFFKSGTLPWWKSLPSDTEFQYSFIQWIHKEQEAVQWLISKASQTQSIEQRIENQLSFDSYKALVDCITQDSTESDLYDNTYTLLEKATPSSIPSLLRAIWKHRLVQFASENSSPNDIASVILFELKKSIENAIHTKNQNFFKLFETYLKKAASDQKPFIAKMLLSCIQEIDSESLPQSYSSTHSRKKTQSHNQEPLHFIPTQLIKGAAIWAKATQAGNPSLERTIQPKANRSTAADSSTTELNIIKTPDDFDNTAVLDRSKELSSNDNTSEPSSIESVYIENAGLVIFAPFLPIFLERCLVRLSKDSSNRHNEFRAPALLQQLVSEESPIPEYMLPLNKILCGFPLETPLPKVETFEEQELDHGRDLLKSIISRWNRLGRTSAKSLQSTFIQRKGVLSKSDFGWLLRVEKAPHDVLIDTIPWTFRTIQYSWMPQPLVVEW